MIFSAEKHWDSVIVNGFKYGSDDSDFFAVSEVVICTPAVLINTRYCYIMTSSFVDFCRLIFAVCIFQISEDFDQILSGEIIGNGISNNSANLLLLHVKIF